VSGNPRALAALDGVGARAVSNIARSNKYSFFFPSVIVGLRFRFKV